MKVPRKKKPKFKTMKPKPSAVNDASDGPPAVNTTCDIYHAGNAPPATPDIEAAAIHLRARFHPGSESSEGDQDFRWTHIGYFDKTVDIRDAWPAAADSNIYVPNKDGTKLAIVFVELVNRGTPTEHKRVYLDRQAVTWPSDEL